MTNTHVCEGPELCADCYAAYLGRHQKRQRQAAVVRWLARVCLFCSLVGQPLDPAGRMGVGLAWNVAGSLTA